jgi:Flp pilus assembly pilin Flp
MTGKLGRARRVVHQGLRVRHGEAGTTAVEYALMTGFIAAVVVPGVFALGIKVTALFAMGVAIFP